MHASPRANPGPDASRAVGPVRTCVGCRARGPRSVLLRVVAVTDDAGTLRAVVDTRRSLPGRGAWVHADPGCLELAERRRAFPRALRTGPLDTTPVREHVAGGGTEPQRPSVESSGSGSGLEKPMGTR